MEKLQRNLRHIYVLSAHGQCIIENEKLIKQRIPDNLYIIFTCPFGCAINNTSKPLNKYFKNVLEFIYKGNLTTIKYAKVLGPGDLYPDLHITTNNNISHKGYHHLNLKTKTMQTEFGKFVPINNTLSNIVGNYTNNVNSNNVGILVVDTCRTIIVDNLLTPSNQGFINRNRITNSKTQSKQFTPRGHSITTLKNLANNISTQHRREDMSTNKFLGNLNKHIHLQKQAAKVIQQMHRSKVGGRSSAIHKSRKIRNS